MMIMVRVREAQRQSALQMPRLRKLETLADPRFGLCFKACRDSGKFSGKSLGCPGILLENPRKDTRNSHSLLESCGRLLNHEFRASIMTKIATEFVIADKLSQYRSGETRVTPMQRVRDRGHVTFLLFFQWINCGGRYPISPNGTL